MQEKIDDLPLLPQVLVKLMQLNRLADDYFDEFELLVREDPTFAVRVVALANSSVSSPVTPITTIREAITRMGAATIGSLVASLAVQRVFMPSKPGEKRLWTHSVTTACASEHVARLAADLKVDPAQAYLAGLLHDIGRFVMMEHASEALQAVDESNWGSPDELVEADVEVYKYTHSELGYLACKHWGLPTTIADVVRAHHDELPGAIEPQSTDALTYCIQLADRLSIYVLDSDNVDADDNGESIRKCTLEIENDLAPTAEALVDKIPTIKEDCDRLLCGLGL